MKMRRTSQTLKAQRQEWPALSALEEDLLEIEEHEETEEELEGEATVLEVKPHRKIN
jgi:hypothetical protein